MKSTILPVSILIAAALIGGAILLSSNDGPRANAPTNAPKNNANNVSIIDGKQIIEISARGGFQPKASVAKAGLPTILRLKTSGTFDCSSIVRIPSMNITKNLPPSGITDIDLGDAQIGTVQGTCGMGMYRFQIEFRG